MEVGDGFPPCLRNTCVIWGKMCILGVRDIGTMYMVSLGGDAAEIQKIFRGVAEEIQQGCSRDAVEIWRICSGDAAEMQWR